MANKYLIMMLCSITLVFTGCTAINTFPVAARPGDTVALAVGSPDGMTRANTTATFTYTSGVMSGTTIDLDNNLDDNPVDPNNIRSIFKLYADQTSKVFDFGGNTNSLIASAGHEPWLTVVAIELPVGMAEGDGYVQFNTSASYPSIGSHINDVSIPLLILPGEGSHNEFFYELGLGAQTAGNLKSLEPRPHAVLGPDYPSPSCPCPDYGAIEIKVNMQTNLEQDLTPIFMNVIADDMGSLSSSGRGVLFGLAPNEDMVTQDLTVMLISPTGKLKYYEARLSVVLNTGVFFTATPTVTSVRYFDIDGTEVGGPVADYTVAMR